MQLASPRDCRLTSCVSPQSRRSERSLKNVVSNEEKADEEKTIADAAEALAGEESEDELTPTPSASDQLEPVRPTDSPPAEPRDDSSLCDKVDRGSSVFFCFSGGEKQDEKTEENDGVFHHGSATCASGSHTSIEV